MTRLTGRSILLALAMVTALLSTGGAAGCGTNNPVATAYTASPEYRAETVAFALAKSYVVVAKQAQAIWENPQTPPSVARGLIDAHQAASPVVKQLRTTALAVEEVRAAVVAGTSLPEKLLNALAALDKVMTEAAPKLDSLATAVNGGGS